MLFPLQTNLDKAHSVRYAVFWGMDKRSSHFIIRLPPSSANDSARRYGYFSAATAPLAVISVVVQFVGLCFDIVDILNLMKLPKRAIYFGSFSLLTKDDSPIVIHRLSVTPALDGIKHQQFEYCCGKLTEKEQICETPETERIRQEFIEQFHLKSL